MNRLLLIVPLFLLLLITSCQATKVAETYTSEELELARQGIEEMAVLTARSAIAYLPNKIEGFTREELFTPEILSLLTLYRDTPGIEKRAGTCEDAIRKSLTRFVRENYAHVDALIQIPEIEQPYSVINGTADAVTAITSTRFVNLISSSVQKYLEEDENLTRATSELLSILNTAIRIQAYRDNSPVPSGVQSIPLTAAIDSALAVLSASMAAEEEVIRSLAINYDSAAIRLFAR